MYAQAHAAYRQAGRYAQERAIPRFRSGMALMAMNRFPEALGELKRGLQIDPTWPETGEALDAIYGVHTLAKLSMKHRVANWVRRDVRDPDRLFLLGVVLHFDLDERAGAVFESALRLGGRGEHLTAFLRPAEGPNDPNTAPKGSGDAQRSDDRKNSDRRTREGAQPPIPPLPEPSELPEPTQPQSEREKSGEPSQFPRVPGFCRCLERSRWTRRTVAPPRWLTRQTSATILVERNPVFWKNLVSGNACRVSSEHFSANDTCFADGVQLQLSLLRSALPIDTAGGLVQ
jgi:hypothetical protein